MADFWGTLGNVFGDITGANQANRAQEQYQAGQGNQAAGGSAMGSAAGTAGQLAQKGAGQFAQEAGQAGQALGQQMGQEAATQGSQAAAQSARTSGVNKGQAAILGGQEAGRAYTQGQQAGRGMGMNAYGQGASTQLGAVGTQGNIGSMQGALGSQQMQGSQSQAAQGNAATGGLLSAVGGLFSDEKMKEGVKRAPDIEQILKKIKPVAFEYKPEAGQGDGEHVGVVAQDLEKTPLKENVIDTPMGKMIHPGKQENSNLDLIVQLAARVHELEGQLKGAK